MILFNPAGLMPQDREESRGVLIMRRYLWQGDFRNLPVAQVGDLVAVYQSGAYGPSASPQGFLGHPACVEVLV